MLRRRKYKLQIAEPCHEKWENMHPVSGGRFCDSCTKNVVDFTGMNTEEIAAYFRNKPVNVCGRFVKDQLDTTYTRKPQLKLPFHKRVLQFMLSLFVSNAVAQSDTLSVKMDTVALSQNDSIPVLATNDSLQADSTSILATNDTMNPDSIPQITWTWDPEEISVFPVQIGVIECVIVSGYTVMVDPEPEPGFFDLCKVKVMEAIKPRRTEHNIESPILPEPQKEPLRIPTEELVAVLNEGSEEKSGIISEDQDDAA